jgi:hypothetical protein
MIERYLSRVIVTLVLALVISEAITKWWGEERHHKDCDRD